MTSGSITIGGTSGGSSTLTIQRPIQLSAGANPAAVTNAIGYILPNVNSSSGVTSAPANTFTWNTGLMTLGLGVWMLSIGANLNMAASIQDFNYNMGFMNTVPVVGDSPTASQAPTNTISGINGNIRNDDNANLTNGNYIYQVGGVIVNNYDGIYNSMYGIFNADWSVGTITMASLTIRATKIG